LSDYNPAPGELEWGARRYAWQPLTIARLETGAWAIGSGYADRELFIIVEEDEVLKYIAEFQEAARAERPRRPAAPDPITFDDLENFTL
jgi:hypothetical protein